MKIKKFKKMKTLDLRTTVVGTLALVVALAFVPITFAVEPATTWSMLGTHDLDFTCGVGLYPHTMTVNAEDMYAGTFSGTGVYEVNNGYTWNVNGTVSGNDIDFTVLYTGIGAGSTYNLSGTIAPNGSIFGTVDSNCQTFSMPVDSWSSFVVHALPSERHSRRFWSCQLWSFLACIPLDSICRTPLS